MRRFALFTLSLILGVQSVIGAGAMAASASFAMNSTGSTAGPVPKKGKKVNAKAVDPESPSSNEDLTAAKSGNLAGQALPYYLLGGLAAGGIIAAGGGGGGGSGSTPAPVTPTPPPTPTPNPTPPSSFETPEYLNQYGLGTIKASSAYARGYTGMGSVVAVLDGGFKPYDLGTDTNPPFGNFVQGYDFVTNDTNPFVPADSDEHATRVSRVIAGLKNGLDGHGVAYNAKIMPLRIFSNGSGSLLTAAPALDYAKNSASVDVINLSFGSLNRIPTGTGFYYGAPLASKDLANLPSSYIGALANAEAANKVIVFAAGNDGFNSETGRIAYYSNQNFDAPVQGSVTYEEFLASTGVSAADYRENQSTLDARLPLVAGTGVGTGTWLNVIATDQNNVIADFSNGCGDTKNFCLAAPGVDITDAGVNGTSFAAPHVSGAVAVLMGAFPNLTPEQVVTLLLDTATDLGAADVDDVYGHGLVNLDEATKPQGTTTVATASGLTAPVPSGLLSSAFGDSLQAGSVAFLDSYGRVYNAPVNSLVTEINPADLTDKFGALWQSASAFAARDDRGQAGSIYNWSASSDKRDDTVGVAASSLGYIKGGGVSPLFAYQSSDTLRAGFAMNPAVYADQDANRMQISVPVSPTSALRVGSAFSKNYSAEGSVPIVNDNKTMGYDLEYAQRIADDLDVAAFTGVMREKGQVLGALFNGAFEVDATNTTFAGISATYSLTPSTFLTGNYMYATSDVQTQNQAFAMNDVSSDSTMLGLVSTDVASSGDAAMVSLRQPLRNRSGSGSLSSISGYQEDGGYASRTTNYDLTPSGREQTLEFAYSTPVGQDQSVTFTIGGSQDYANIAGQDEAHALAVYRLTW